MKRSLRDKWCAALRDGSYKQGTSRLRTPDNKFCCWGVFCDLIDPSLWKQVNKVDTYNHWEYNNSTLMPSAKILTENLGDNEFTLDNNLHSISGYLANQNDAGKTFLEIADLIEQIVPVEDD